MEEGQAVAVADDKVGLVMGRRMTELQGQLPTPDSLGGRLQISVCGRQLGQPLNPMDPPLWQLNPGAIHKAPADAIASTGLCPHSFPNHT